MKYILLAITAVFIFAGCSTKIEKGSSDYLTGMYSWPDWQKNAGWGDYSAPEYYPEPEFVKKISGVIKNGNYKFLIFAGSWCHDSQVGVPEIYKLAEEANIPEKEILLYGVDRDKREPSGTAEKYKIEKVPTLVVLKNGKEIGRIIEYPVKSWDEDLYNILKYAD